MKDLSPWDLWKWESCPMDAEIKVVKDSERTEQTNEKEKEE